MTLATVAAASGEEIVPFEIARAEKSVFRALLDARAQFGAKKTALVDGDGRAFSYDELARAVFALGHALKKGTRPRDTIGIMLPTSAASVISFFAVGAYGRIPAMLNFTAGVASLRSAIGTVEIRRVITSRRFIEIAKLDWLIAELSSVAKIVYLEDVRAKIGLLDKLAAFAGLLLPGMILCKPAGDDPAVILFTSGTEGEPKGVALSHRNLLANVEQVRSHIAIYPTDILFNPLPTFHCFGLTVGALMPLMLGIATILHPTPLQPREIVRRIRDSGTTILLSTDTFISQYARAGEPGDFTSLRLAVCGAERLREETRALFRNKYALELLEGYGVTEASPVVAANQPGADRHGTVGRLVQRIEAKLEPVAGMPQAGRLLIKGPNIMLGYVLPDRPGVVQHPPHGWHDTGDIASIDPEGFISIKGRAKRFAKVGGEIVSLAVAESCASALWPEHCHASISVPDSRKGEQILLVTTNFDANRHDLVDWAQNHGIPELAVPRKIICVQQIPVLGTGKTDYVQVEAQVREQMTSKSQLASEAG